MSNQDTGKVVNSGAKTHADTVPEQDQQSLWSGRRVRCLLDHSGPASYLAGLHFERLFVLIGIILAIMAVIGAFVEQYTLWLIVIPVSVVAAWLFLKSRLSHAHT